MPGSGLAGTVSSVGAGVDPGWIGRRVLTDTRESGSYAERVSVPADGLVGIPDELTDAVAAALLTDGRTALRVLDSVSIHAGTPVLITGAGGGMGLLLVGLVTARGARVVGAARGEAKLAATREQGADAAVDYSVTDWTDRVLTALDDDAPAVVLDGVGGDIGRAAFAITAGGGQFFAHGAASGDFAPPDDIIAATRELPGEDLPRDQLHHVGTAARAVISRDQVAADRHREGDQAAGLELVLVGAEGRQ